MGYRQRALSGFGWQTVLKIVSNAVVLGKIMVLARLLSPQSFGVFSLVTIALGLTEAVTQTGVNITLLQAKQRVELYINTAWVIAIIRGFGISCLMIAVGWGMSRFFADQSLFFMVALASAIPLIKGFINPMIVSLQKEFRFFSDTVYRFSLVVIDAGASVALVWLTGSVWGWILALVVTALFEVVISFFFFSKRPAFEFVWHWAEPILKHARAFAFSSVLSYLLENADNLIVGKLLGTYNLGLYQNTYSLTHELNYEVSKSVHHGSFPVMTKISDDQKRLRWGWLKSLGFTLGVGLLLSSPLLVAPGFFINLIFGAEWTAAIPLVRALIVAGLVQAVSMSCYTVLLARKQIVAMNVHMGLAFLAMVSGMLVLSGPYGLVGAVVGVAASRLAAIPLLLWITYRATC